MKQQEWLMYQVVAVAFVFASALSGADPFVGTWKLDTVRSSGNLPKAEEIVVAEIGATLDVRLSIVTEDGRPLSIAFTVPKRGGTGQVREGPYDSVSMTRSSRSEMEMIYTNDRKPVRSTRVRLEKGGHTMTSTGGLVGAKQPAGWVMVFEKKISSSH